MFNMPNYNYNYPWTYNNNQTIPQIQSQPQSNGINWVQGEAGAKSYAIAPGQSILLMDSENNVFYIKSSDYPSGMPKPLRIFDYTERIVTTNPVETTSKQTADYVTREEFEKRLAEITNAKQRVSTTKQQQQ